MRRVPALLLAGGLIVGAPGLAHADHDDGDRYGNGEYEHDYGNRGDNSERRERGAFSPGPFRDSPITIIVCPPGTQECGNGQPDRREGDG